MIVSARGRSFRNRAMKAERIPNAANPTNVLPKATPALIQAPIEQNKPTKGANNEMILHPGIRGFRTAGNAFVCVRGPVGENRYPQSQRRALSGLINPH